MKFFRAVLTITCTLGLAGFAQADIIEYADQDAFADATGAESLTGALPDLGGVGKSVTLGDVTLTAGNTIFVGDTYTSARNAIAISGKENLGIAIDVGLATSFGFWFLEPNSSTATVDGCNATCIDSSFQITFYLGGAMVSSTAFNPGNDAWKFYGITPDVIFDEIRFAELEGGIDNEFFGEMYAARVPEPGTLALLGIGLVGAGFARRRKKAP